MELSPRRICFNNADPSWNVSDFGLKKKNDPDRHYEQGEDRDTKNNPSRDI